MERDPRKVLFGKFLKLVDKMELNEDMDFDAIFVKEKASEILKDIKGKEENIFNYLVKPDPEETESLMIDVSNQKISLEDLPDTASETLRTVGYLYDLLDKIRNGEIAKVTAIALQNDGKSFLWLPRGLSDDESVQEYYAPIIEIMRDTVEERSDIN